MDFIIKGCLKSEYIDDFKKFAILKKGIWIESQKPYKQVKDQSIETR